MGATRREAAADGTSAVSTLREDGSIDFTITAPDGTTHFVNLDDRGARLVARDQAGAELGYLARDGRVRAIGR